MSLYDKEAFAESDYSRPSPNKLSKIPSLGSRVSEVEEEVLKFQSIIERLEYILDNSINGPGTTAISSGTSKDRAEVVPLPNRLNYCKNVMAEYNARLAAATDKLQEYLS